MADTPADQAAMRGLVKSPLDFAGGLFLIAIAIAGFAGGFSLPVGHLSGIGSGLMPKAVAVLVGAFGIALVLQSVLLHGDRLEAWAVRGPIFVLAGVLLFAATVRSWGLIVAGPTSFIVAALADRDSRPSEMVVMAVVMTLLCGLLFKELLSLPIPFDPAGRVPTPIVQAYVEAKSGLVQAFASLKALFAR